MSPRVASELYAKGILMRAPCWNAPRYILVLAVALALSPSSLFSLQTTEPAVDQPTAKTAAQLAAGELASEKSVTDAAKGAAKDADKELILLPQPKDPSKDPNPTYCGTAELHTPCRINDKLVVGIANLPAWMKAKETKDVPDFYLVVNGREMKGVTGEAAPGRVTFTLDPTRAKDNEDRADWSTLISELGASSPVQVSVGSAKFPTHPTPVSVNFAGIIKGDPLILWPQPKESSNTVSYCETTGVPCYIDKTISLGFVNLKAWMNLNNAKASDIYLVLNGREMKGITGFDLGPSGNSLSFRLDPTNDTTKDDQAQWNTLIPELRDSKNSDGIALLHVSVGYAQSPAHSKPVDVDFRVYPDWIPWLVLFLLVMLVAFVFLALKSDIVRNAPSIVVPTNTNEDKDAKVKQSYSLGRCQMAWWYFIVSASYCFIWAVLKNHDTITEGVLVLTGISTATGLAGSVISSNTSDPSTKQAADVIALQNRIAALHALIDAASADPIALATLQAELHAKTDELTNIANHGVTSTDGFLFDILRDENGISFHRFQMAGWTVILGFVFIAAVWSGLTMPNFSSTLLGLMGISSGTYIGFKLAKMDK